MTSDQNRTGVPPLSADSGVRTPDVYLADPDVTLYHGDALETLRGMPDESVHCVVTSPPYWGLRDYGTGLWDGGDPDCDHRLPVRVADSTTSTLQSNKKSPGLSVGTEAVIGHRQEPFRDVCGKCGAHRTDNQMGLEPTPELYVQNMVTVFREVRRVLRRDGTCWLNIGDSYAGGNQGGTTRNKELPAGEFVSWSSRIQRTDLDMKAAGLKPKDLVGIPWRLAFALQADGWWLRADIIWAKPNPMPESVTDRPTKAHEYMFLLTRSPRYFFDQEAVREPAEYGRREQPDGWIRGGPTQGRDGRTVKGGDPSAGRNVRSVWEIATEPFPQAHFATFPTELARRCILAGTSERGCCPECGAPWERQTDVSYEKSPVHGAGSVVGRHEASGQNNYDGAGMPRVSKVTQTLGWRPTCDCLPADFAESNLKPCTVLDPFAGACTVPHVARQHGRHAIGIELSETYLREIALPRLQQLSLLA